MIAHDVSSAPREECDAFYWLGQINKASLVINARQGLLDAKVAPRIAAGLYAVLENGKRPSSARPSLVITFEPLLVEAAGIEATLLHAGRSSQDMLATVSVAIYRDRLLQLAAQLNRTATTLCKLADEHRATIVPNYTNGVAAQPNSYGHYLLGHWAGLRRDFERLKQVYARINLSPMGTTVLNGTSWPLDREAMAEYLGFDGIVENAYDAAQVAGAEIPVEIGAVAVCIALHTAAFVQDVMVQYAQAQPWISLDEQGGNTYPSSAMPQKRNPGLLNDLRADASAVLASGMGRSIAAHNIPPGMNDAKRIHENVSVLDSTSSLLGKWDKALNALVINAGRALDELNSDWTASQEIADVLMRKYGLPFRAGHHFASEVVNVARSEGLKPSEFPYATAASIFREMKTGIQELPMDELEFRQTLDPTSIVNNRATRGGPQPAEMQRMLAIALDELSGDADWIADRRRRIDVAQTGLEDDFCAYVFKS